MKSVAITTTYKAIADLDTGAARMNIVQPLATYDDSAHVFAVEIRRGSSAEELSGTTCIGYFVRADGVTIPIDGETKGNVATVILAANCYAVAGGFALAVKLSMGNVVHTVLRATGNVSVSQTDEMASPGTGVQSFDKLVEAAEKAEGYDARITETEKTVDTLVEQTQKIPLSIQVNLSSTQPAAVDGTNNLKPGRTGVLSIDGGGTGATSKKEARINIGAASVEEVRQRDRVQNLLDNSWFANPVAQAGQNGMHGSNKYVCDRWISWDEDATFANGCMTPGTPVDQRLDPDMISQTKTYTVAICLSDGTIKAASGTFASGIGSYALGVIGAGTTAPYVRINTGITVRWAALYEGTYTADTLPAYVYKGYAAELAECQRYFRRIRLGNGYLSAIAYSDVSARIFLPFGMRTIAPTIVWDSKLVLRKYSHNTEYAITNMSGSIGSESGFSLTITTSGITAGETYILQSGDAYRNIDISADL